MINFNEIKDVHIELTTLCNARCPLCVRNANGYPHNFGYPEVSLTLEQVKQILYPEFIQQLDTLNICGNYGDFVANQEALEIVDYIGTTNPALRIAISTNGGARSTKFWQQLAKYNVHMYFCIEGLEDTHSIYRVDTSFTQVIKNAKAFIDAGGNATWKMIMFEHNKHQVAECTQMSKDLGFKDFNLTDHSRSQGSVFDREGNYQYHIGPDNGTNNIESVIKWHERADIVFNYPEPKQELNCYSNNSKSIYLAANGEIYPCCYLGFYPKTFTNGMYFSKINEQLAELLNGNENNALVVGLQSATEWFNKIEERWAIDNYQAGRLLGCDEHCGSNKYINRLA